MARIVNSKVIRRGIVAGFRVEANRKGRLWSYNCEAPTEEAVLKKIGGREAQWVVSMKPYKWEVEEWSF